MVQNIKLKCKCGCVLISSPPRTSKTPANQVVCTWAAAFLHGDRHWAEHPEEQSQSKMGMMTLDLLLWTRLRWILNGVWREAWEMRRMRGLVLTCSTSDQPAVPLVSSWLNSYLWTFCKHRQTSQIKGQVTEDFPLHMHIYKTVCVFVHLLPCMFNS